MAIKWGKTSTAGATYSKDGKFVIEKDWKLGCYSVYDRSICLVHKETGRIYGVRIAIRGYLRDAKEIAERYLENPIEVYDRYNYVSWEETLKHNDIKTTEVQK